MSVEEHKNTLKTLCRICCSKIENCNKNNLISEINDIYKLNVQNENEDIFPQIICSACKLKLTRYRQNKASCSINFCEIYEFELHSTDCKICISKTGRPKILERENCQ